VTSPEGPRPTPQRASAAIRAERFQAERERLVGLAYRMLGSRAEAEDVVQDAWLRYDRQGAEPRNLAAWLTTVTSRLALDRLRSSTRRREAYVGPWLPEPVRTDIATATTSASGSADPADVVDRAASLTLGFLVVLDTLSPEDRATFLLADVFGVPFAEVAEIVGRSPEACRQAASRARRRLRDAAPPQGDAGQELATQLAAALAAGDVEATLRLLAPDVVLVSDGGPSQRAARRPVLGPDRVSRFLLKVTRGLEHAELERAEVNGRLSVIARFAGQPFAVLTADPSPDGRVAVVRLLLAPEKLASLDAEPLR
jgi:RNA polymerase sigma-70 factor (ECF subfamily)